MFIYLKCVFNFSECPLEPRDSINSSFSPVKCNVNNLHSNVTTSAGDDLTSGYESQNASSESSFASSHLKSHKQTPSHFTATHHRQNARKKAHPPCNGKHEKFQSHPGLFDECCDILQGHSPPNCHNMKKKISDNDTCSRLEHVFHFMMCKKDL